MGATQAAAFAEAVEDGTVGLEQALHYHLRCNHFPPVPLSMIPVCIAAIEAGEDEDWDLEIDLPEGSSYRGRSTAPAWAIIEGHHLEVFLDSGDFWVTCDECGRRGNADDLCEIDGECPDEDCDGITRLSD